MKVFQVCSYYANPLYKLLFDELRSLGVAQKTYYFAPKGTQFVGDPDVIFSECYGQADRLLFGHKEGKVIRELHQRINVEEFDLLHAHSLFANGYVALDTNRQLGIPYVVAVRNSDLNAFLRPRPWLRSLGLQIMREASQVIFISPAYQERVLGRFVPADLRDEIETKSIVIPNGVNEVFLTSKPMGHRESDNTIRVITAGDIDRNKNQLTVARACQLLEARGYQVVYRVVGRVRVSGIARRLAQYGFVEICDPVTQEHLIQKYRESDVFVMPSRHETFGLVYAEAMSQGLPVVYTCGEGFDGFFSDGEVGYRVQSGSAMEIAQAILACYERRSEFLASNPKAASQFDWACISKTYRQLYGLVLSA